jgi:hypothetical protein
MAATKLNSWFSEEVKMDIRRPGCVLLLIVSLALLAGSNGCGSLGSPLVTEAQAQTLGTPMVCSQSSLSGSYGLWEWGTILGQLPNFPPPPFPTTDVVLITYDGAGHFTGSFTANDGGYPEAGTFDGTYTVNADCTYTGQYVASVFPIAFHLTGTIVGQGAKQEIRYMYTEPFMVAWGTGKKTQPGGCSVANLKGAYGDAEQATVVAGFGAPPGTPASGSGILTFDGKGSFTVNEQLSIGGVVAPEIGAGTYKVNPDCTYSDVFTDTDGFVSHDAGILVGQGEFQELHMIYADPGVVVAGTSKKQ